MTYVPRLGMGNVAHGFSFPLVSRLGNAVSFGGEMMPTSMHGLPVHPPLPDPAQEAQRQLLMQAIMPLGQQMKSIGLDYQESSGQYLLMTSAFYDSSSKKKLVLGLVAGAAVGALIVAFIK